MTNWIRGVCDANGINIHYLRTGGHKPPLIPLHGLTGSGACWIPLARALEDDFDVVMPDARGQKVERTASWLSVPRPRKRRRWTHRSARTCRSGSARPLDGTAAVVASRVGRAIRGVILADPTFLSPQRQREVHESDVIEQHRSLLSLNKVDVLAQARLQHPHRSFEFVELITVARLRTQITAF